MAENSKKTRFPKGHVPANKGAGDKSKPKTCIVCRSIFFSEWNKKKTCSKECRYKACALRDTRLIRICPVCKKEFKVYAAWARRGRGNDGTYCSNECRWGKKMRYTKEEKNAARNYVAKCIRLGLIIRKKCVLCGNPKTEAHHHLGYAQENWEKITWLCEKCHVNEHERIRRTGLTELL